MVHPALVAAQSDLLAVLLLFAPLVVGASAVVLTVLWAQHRGESTALFERMVVAWALTLGSIGWSLLILADMLAIQVPIDLSTWTIGLSVLMPAVISVIWVALYASGRFGRH